MTDQAKPISRSWRRFLRFSVRGLIVLVLVVGAGLGWIVREAHIQRDAVAAITTIGGEVNYDWEWCDGAPVPGAQPSAPRWLTPMGHCQEHGPLFSPPRRITRSVWRRASRKQRSWGRAGSCE
jgi:hypothetical protein